MSKADKLRIPDYLGHILEAIQRIHRYVEDMDEMRRFYFDYLFCCHTMKFRGAKKHAPD